MKIETVDYGDVYIWPHPVQEPVKETLEWLTFNLESYSGKDYCTNFRETPRLSFNVNSQLDLDVRSDAYHLLHTNAAELWGIPHWAYAERINLLSGSTSVEVVSPFFENGLALFWKPSQLVEVREFTKVGNSLSFTALDQDYVNGLIVPIHLGTISDIKIPQTALFAEASFSFRSEYNYSIAEGAPNLYRGNEIYYGCPIYTGNRGIEDTVVRRIDFLDNETGIWSRNSPWTCSRIKRIFGIDFEGKADIESFVQWLSRRKGKYLPFWTPSWTKDISITSTGLIGTTFLISNSGFSFCRDNIAVLSKQGDWYPRQIIDATLVGQNIQLTLDSALTLDASDIDRVCYIDIFRLDTDRIEIQHRGYRSISSSFPIVSIDYVLVESNESS